MSQSLAQVYLHIVFSTKNRKPFLGNEANAAKVHAYLAGICKNHECDAIIIGGTGDHVHLLCSLSRRKAISDLIRELKTTSSEWAKKELHLSDFHWQSGYGAFSVSRSQCEKVIEYISTQREHHRQLSFQEEFLMLLKRHGVDFDEKFVWD